MSNDSENDRNDANARTGSRARGGSIRLGIGVGIGAVRGLLDRLRRGRGSGNGPSSSSERAGNSKRTRTKRAVVRAGDDGLIATRRAGDEFVVVADVNRTSADDVTAGIDPDTGELVIGKRGRVLGRVAVPWEPIETTARFNNGVLEVRLQRRSR